MRGDRPASGLCHANKAPRRVPILRLSLWLSGSCHYRGFSPRRRCLSAPGGRARRTAGSGAVTIVLRGWAAGEGSRRPDLASGLSLRPAPPPLRAGEAPLPIFPEKASYPRTLPNSGRRRTRASPKNPDRSQSPERAEGASHPRPPEPFRKGPKFPERPSCRTAGGGRSAMLDALLVE
nr:uncharacterized protein LOC105873622 [Microcebus murinus]